ncbi:uncharacterized protein [Parasteatoda tepidariorum]|uniref:uncharacterized protein n=1 Tax=Parasteatoda tepidariorum TaxID=114398 RepID=UPI001C71E0EB|nr:uncharacterized protein LOC107441069 [Parasteatoda tepidariorum]
MKYQLIFAVFALFAGGAQCSRIRRAFGGFAGFGAAPAAIAAPSAPVAVPSNPAAPAAAPMAAFAADPGASVTTPKTAGLNLALGFMVDELDKQQSLGGPVNPGGLQKACIVASKIKMLGGEVDKPTQDKLDSLVADYAVQAVDPAAFSAFAAPPAGFL